MYKPDLKKLNNRWFNWQQPACPFFLGPCFQATGKRFRDNFNIPFFTSINYYREEIVEGNCSMQGSWILRLNEGKICGLYLIDLFMNDQYGENFLKKYNEISQEITSLSEEVKESYEEKEELLKDFDFYIEKFIQFYMIGCVTEPIQWACEDILKEIEEPGYFDEKSIVSDWSKERKNKALFSIREPQYINEIEKRLDACIDIVLENWDGINEINCHSQIEKIKSIVDGNSNVKNLLDAFINDFHWKDNNYYECYNLTLDHVLAEISDNIDNKVNLLTQDVEKVNSNLKELINDKKVLLKELNPYHRKIAYILEFYGSSLADNRKKIMLQNLQTLEKFSKNISQISGLDISLVKMAMPEEIGSILENPKNYANRLKNRKKGFMILESPFLIHEEEFDFDESDVASHKRVYPTYAEGDYLKGFFAQIQSKFMLINDTTNQEIIGTVAYKPENYDTIEGVVRIITNPKAEHLEFDEILVATSTTPDFMSHIRKCKAIITNQSGMATHAALTSRELQIPCIVGTGNATFNLKNGDEVKLCLDNGKVEVLYDN